MAKTTEFTEMSPRNWALQWKRNIEDINRMAAGACLAYQAQVERHVNALKKLADKIARRLPK